MPCWSALHAARCTQAQSPIDRSGVRPNSELFAQTVVGRLLSCGESLCRGQTRAASFKKTKTCTGQDASGMPSNRRLAQYGLGANTWRDLGLLCACVDKMYRGSAESNITECANRRFFSPFFLCPLPPSGLYVSSVDCCGRLQESPKVLNGIELGDIQRVFVRLSWPAKPLVIFRSWVYCLWSWVGVVSRSSIPLHKSLLQIQRICILLADVELLGKEWSDSPTRSHARPDCFTSQVLLALDVFTGFLPQQLFRSSVSPLSNLSKIE